MTIRRFIITLRLFGIRGVWDWVIRLFSKKADPLLAVLQLHVKKNETPRRGITIIGEFCGTNSLSKVLRDFAQSLQEAAIPCQTLDTGKPVPKDFVLNRYSEIVGMLRDYPVRRMTGCRQHRIVFWEFDTGFAESQPHLIDGTPILVFSEYCHQSLRRQVHRSMQIRQVRYPFHFDSPDILPSVGIREKYGIHNDAFMVFFNFDYRSSYYRKNPEGLLAAFSEAFGDDSNAVLVFKTNGRSKKIALAEHLEQIAASSAANKKRVVFINDYIAEDELVALTASCDVYASLHRGEGFGLGMAEAMSLGKAVVVTACGANLEFCKPSTAELVPYKTVPVQPDQCDVSVYAPITHWPEPDVHSAAVALRKLYDDPSYRRELGLRAQAFIKDFYSVENFKKSMDGFFNS